MNTSMNITRFIALSAIFAVMGLASSGAVAAGKSALPMSSGSIGKSALPASDWYSKESQLARRAPVEFKPVATKEGETMDFPLSGRSTIYTNGQWVSYNSKEHREAVKARSAPSAQAPASASFKSIPPREGEIMNFPLSGRSAIYKNGQWVNLP